MTSEVPTDSSDPMIAAISLHPQPNLENSDASRVQRSSARGNRNSSTKPDRLGADFGKLIFGTARRGKGCRFYYTKFDCKRCRVQFPASRPTLYDFTLYLTADH